MNYKIFPLSENSLTIDFGNEISIELNEKVIALGKLIEQSIFSGFIETIPAYSSLTVFYDLIIVRKHFAHFPDAFSAVKHQLEILLQRLEKTKKDKPHLINIPVNYSKEFGLDLEFVARNSDLSIKEVIEIHTSKTYRVFMIGFLPAFAYLGEVDERIVTPRKQTPRTKIKKGSVGIAGKQTGIYPLESPGGWQIIGKTALEIFQPQSKKISLLNAGDLVKFFDINQK